MQFSHKDLSTRTDGFDVQLREISASVDALKTIRSFVPILVSGGASSPACGIGPSAVTPQDGMVVSPASSDTANHTWAQDVMQTKRAVHGRPDVRSSIASAAVCFSCACPWLARLRQVSACSLHFCAHFAVRRLASDLCRCPIPESRRPSALAVVSRPRPLQREDRLDARRAAACRL